MAPVSLPRFFSIPRIAALQTAWTLIPVLAFALVLGGRPIETSAQGVEKGGDSLAHASLGSSPSPGGSAPRATDPEDPTVADELIDEALERNLGLTRERLSLRQSESALSETQGQYLPRLDLAARYSRSEGGRTIDIPVGDLLNPVYQVLNETSPDSPFPTIANQEIRFFREREQETVLKLRQPVFAPAIVYGSRARRHQRRAQAAAVDAARNELVRDVRIAYYQYRKAQTRVEVLKAARELAQESRRTNARLVEAAKVTRDALYRAEVDVLQVEQQLDDATAQVNRARRYLNVLRNRPAEAPIPAPRRPVTALIDATTVDLRDRIGLFAPTLARGTSFLVGPQEHGRSPSRSMTTTGAHALPQPSSLRAAGIDGWERDRPELTRLTAAAEAADARVRQAQSAYVPTVGIGLDAGIQGRTYGFDGEKPFVMGSVTLSWNLFNGFQDHRRIQQAELEAEKIRTQRADTAQRIRLEIQSAADAVSVAERSIETASARVRAATENYRLTARRHEAGRANQVEFIDARTTLTDAELNLNRTRYDLLIRLAELAYAAGLPARNSLSANSGLPASTSLPPAH